MPRVASLGGTGFGGMERLLLLLDHEEEEGVAVTRETGEALETLA